MPGLRGSAAKGRLIYLIHEPACSVQPIWIYTHDEFDTRPSDRDLRYAFRDAMDRATQYLENSPVINLVDPDGGRHTVEITIRRNNPKNQK